MIALLLDKWVPVLALFGSTVFGMSILVFVAIHFLKKAKEYGVDEVKAGPVEIDFDDKE